MTDDLQIHVLAAARRKPRTTRAKFWPSPHERKWRDGGQVRRIAAGRDHPLLANGCSVCDSESFEASKR